MGQLAPYEKVFVGSGFLKDKNHGSIPCTKCHGGNSSAVQMKTAHTGLIKDPTWPDAQKVCGECHDTGNNKTSLHYTLRPFHSIIKMRAGGKSPQIEKALKNHCSSCHSSCGQCHISRPSSVNGGLIAGHKFIKKAPAEETCTACHGSRVADEFLGMHPGTKPDIHFEKKMNCYSCHSAREMHGDGKKYHHRYDSGNSPSCISCHKKIYSKESKNRKVHLIHSNKTECYVCHSQKYKNCYSCHVGYKGGKPYAKTSPSSLGFKVGLNPRHSKKHPQKFSVLRHIPIARTSFEWYGKNLLKNFDSLPTWKRATPHNIRRKTPQNTSCNSCHGKRELFLLKKDVLPDEQKANRRTIVPAHSIPKSN